MESPGEYLKRERELRGVKLEDLSVELNLSLKTLTALEADNYGELPHPAYVKGFIKAYSRCLGIDEHDSVLRYEAYLEEKEEEKKEDAAKAATGGLFSQNHGLTAAALFAAGVIIIGLYFVFTGGRAPETVEEGQPAAGALPQAEEIKPQGEVEPFNEKAPASPLSLPSGDKKNESVLSPIPSKKLTLDVHADKTTWIRARIDKKDEFEAVLRQGEDKRLEASEVFFCS